MPVGCRRCPRATLGDTQVQLSNNQGSLLSLLLKATYDDKLLFEFVVRIVADGGFF